MALFICTPVCMWQYKYLAILESARDFTQMEWLMAQPPDACQRPFWRCYINHHSLSLSLSPSIIISISLSLYLSHCLLCSPPPSQLVFSLSIRPLWLCQFASLLNFYQTVWWLYCCKSAKSEGNNLTGRKLWGDWHRHVTVQTSLVFKSLIKTFP